MGVAGCGKTSVGEALARALGWGFIEGDAHHAPASIAKMQAGQPLADEDRWGWLDQLGQMLRTQAPVVLSCSALKRAYRERLRAACPAVRFVYMDIDKPLALELVSPRQALLAKALDGIDVRVLDASLGRAAGQLLARARTSDVIDAALVLLAEDGDDLVTSDPDDLEPLAALVGRHVELLHV